MRHSGPNGFVREFPSFNDVGSRKPIPVLYFSVGKPDRSQNELLPVIPRRLPIYSYGNDNLLIYISTKVKIKICVTSGAVSTGFTYFLCFRLCGAKINNLYAKIGWCRCICVVGLGSQRKNLVVFGN